MIDADDVRDLLPAYLARQRWYSGAEPEKVSVDDAEPLHDRMLWLLVDADGARYQVPVGLADAASPPDFLHGHESSIIGAVGDHLVYDALLDAELAHVVLALAAPGEHADRVRPMGAEQSNTSLVFDDRLVLKVFRRVHDGPNPDIEVTSQLGGVGFDHVAVPIGVWSRDERDLAVAQPYLAGATDGWALALTSLRDLYANDCDDPAECGGDFAAEARRLGQVTGELHMAMARAFGTQPGDAGAWVRVMERQLDRHAAGETWAGDARAALVRLRELPSAGASVRVHGDYHLGQVVRTDAGWFVLDFEGEPARPLDERRLPSSPVKDVAGMLRSFHYAQAVALRERGVEDAERCAPLGDAWERRNRDAFLAGYVRVDGVLDLLPGDLGTAIAAWELDKAVYELGYERGHRPDWTDIPQAAIARVLNG